MGYKEDNEKLAADHKTENSGMVMQRHCTDILCCLVFTLYIFAMLGISGLAYGTGDPVKILTPFDSDGN